MLKVNIENQFHLHENLVPGARLFVRLFSHPNQKNLVFFLPKMKAGYQYDWTLIRISTPKGSSKCKYYTPSQVYQKRLWYLGDRLKLRCSCCLEFLFWMVKELWTTKGSIFEFLKTNFRSYQIQITSFWKLLQKPQFFLIKKNTCSAFLKNKLP